MKYFFKFVCILYFIESLNCLSLKFKSVKDTCNENILYDEEILLCIPTDSSLNYISNILYTYYDEKYIQKLKFVIKKKFQNEDFNLENLYMEINPDDLIENFIYTNTSNMLISIFIRFNENLAIIMDSVESTINPGEILINCGGYNYDSPKINFFDKYTFEQKLEKKIFNIYNDEQKDENPYEMWQTIPEIVKGKFLSKIHEKLIDLYDKNLKEICNRGIPLWLFLFELLINQDFSEFISFDKFKLSNSLRVFQKNLNIRNIFHSQFDNHFIIKNPYVVSALWGMCKNQPRMSFKLFSQVLKFYYGGNLLEKINSKHFTFNFKFNMECLIGIDKNELQKMNDFVDYVRMIDRKKKGINAMILSKTNISLDINENGIWNPLSF